MNCYLCYVDGETNRRAPRLQNDVGRVVETGQSSEDVTHHGLLSSNVYGVPASWFPELGVTHDLGHQFLGIKEWMESGNCPSEGIGEISYTSR